MTTPELIAELRAVLVDGRDLADELLARLNGGIEPIEAVSLLEALSLIDERRARVFERFRVAASASRRREEERSIRQFVLRALDEIGTPQTAGFLEDYLYARELVVVKTRGMGALRRDEYRAWHRLRARPRVAYIVPCLDQEGHPISRWMARSDWPLRSRIAVLFAEELWEAHRVRALLKAYREADADADPLFFPLIERYALEVSGDPEQIDDRGKARLKPLEIAVDERISALEADVTPTQERAAASLVGELNEEQQLWGVSSP